MLRTQEFAKEQREKAARKAQQKKKDEKEIMNARAEPNPHAYKNTHAINPSARQASPDAASRLQKNSVIVEQDGEESEISAVNIMTGTAEHAVT